MKKEVYKRPEIKVVRIQHQCHLLSGGSEPVESVGGNTNLRYMGGGSQDALGRRRGDYDDWDE